MRYSNFGALAALTLVLGACHTTHGGPPPPPPPPPPGPPALTPVTCPNHAGSGPPANSVQYRDPLVQVTFNGSATVKPLPMPETPVPQPPSLPPALSPPPTPGVCIDSNGNIRLYHDEAHEVDITFYLDPNLGTWPAPALAFSVSGQPMNNPPSVSGPNLTIYLLPQASGDHDYVMQYLNGQGVLTPTEPAIQNH